MLITKPNRSRAPKCLVENRVSFAGPNAELSIYDTYLPARNVALTAGELLYCGMIKGRKVLHGAGGFEAEFVPQQSFVMAPGELIHIDFPDAELNAPTSCLTVEIAPRRITQICDNLNRHSPLQRDFEEWRFRSEARLHTTHTPATQSLLERLTQTFTENSDDRDLLIDLGISELVVRMLRHQTRAFLLRFCRDNPEANGMTAAIRHLLEQLEQPLDIERLCRIACMSRSRFFKAFKQHMGCTPAEFQQQLRLQRAAELLREGHSATAVCYQTGYRDLSHFSRRFQEFHGMSPRRYQLSQRSAVGGLPQ